MKIRKAYICSPYRGDTTKNTELAWRLSQYAVKQHYIPIAPHLYFPHVLDDDQPQQRASALDINVKLLRDCTHVFAYTGNVSEGMRIELFNAHQLNIPVTWVEIITDNHGTQHVRRRIVSSNENTIDDLKPLEEANILEAEHQLNREIPEGVTASLFYEVGIMHLKITDISGTCIHEGHYSVSPKTRAPLLELTWNNIAHANEKAKRLLTHKLVRPTPNPT